MSKRANGEGNIRKRPDGKWEGRYVYNGKRYSVYGKTQAEVRKKLTEAQAQIDGGAYIAPSKITVEEWLDRWQKECLHSVKLTTRVRYEIVHHSRNWQCCTFRIEAAYGASHVFQGDRKRAFRKNYCQFPRHITHSITAGSNRRNHKAECL